MHPKIDGVVVLYHPDNTIFDNIDSYINGLSTLYVIDNSEIKNEKLIEKLKVKYPTIKYIDNGGNQGIAHALNIGAKLAIENGADWLLTMDQDSKFENNDLQKMIQWVEENKTIDIGIVSPMHEVDEKKKYKFYKTITMTSGNLLNLDIYKYIGGFREDFFIDCVDTEFCLRLKKYNLAIKRIEDVVLTHQLGNKEEINSFGISFSVTNHNYMRRYYITRNRFRIWNEYENIDKPYIQFEKIVTIKEIIKIILAESDKFLKLKYSIRGYLDYRNSKYGKYHE